MSDWRTPEQQEADEHLREAILGCFKAYNYGATTPGGSVMMLDYVVLTAGAEFLTDGTTKSHYNRLYADGSMPDYRALGLMDMHRLMLQGDITDRAGEEEAE